jgi:hypothetical protein
MIKMQSGSFYVLLHVNLSDCVGLIMRRYSTFFRLPIYSIWIVDVQYQPHMKVQDMFMIRPQPTESSEMLCIFHLLLWLTIQPPWFVPHFPSHSEWHTPIYPQQGMAGLLVHRLLTIPCDSNVNFALVQPRFWRSNIARTNWTCFLGSFTWHLMLHTTMWHLILIIHLQKQAVTSSTVQSLAQKLFPADISMESCTIAVLPVIS